MNKKILKIRGMHCKSCEILIEKNIKKINGVESVKADYKKGVAEIFYKNNNISQDEFIFAVQNAGYEIGDKDNLPFISSDPKDYKNLLVSAVILFLLYIVGKRLGIFNLSVSSDFDNMGLIVALVVGLIAGISTCMALVGGLILGLSASHAEMHPEATPVQKFRPHIYFNLGRILGYIILGGLIGLVGTALSPFANILGVMTIFVGGVMIFLGLKLIEIFPVLRDKTIALPKFISKAFGLHKENKEYSHKGALLTGALTFFLPCGFTQAMQLYALSTGSFVQGAIIMGLFALGTAPGLLGIGGLSSIFKGQAARRFFMTAGLAIIFLGLFNIANGSRLISFGTNQNADISVNNDIDVNDTDIQEVRMDQNAFGYEPNQFTIQKGKKVRWIIDSKNQFSCATSLVVPSLGISKNLKKGENIIEFTPSQTGEIPFSCSMGMYRGKFIVVDGDFVSNSKSDYIAQTTNHNFEHTSLCPMMGSRL
jgi:sulfite exporter TauE/SafE/copper chaperone CopZ